MLNSLIINGFDTKSIKNCYLTDIGTLQVAKTKVIEDVKIFGLNGTYSIYDGAYESYERTIVFSVEFFENVSLLVSKFKNTDNKIIFEYLQNSFYFADLIDVNFTSQGKKNWLVNIKLRFDPFRYKNTETITLVKSGSINNIGDVFCEPIITIEGSGDISITIGSQIMYLNVDTKVTIDCRHKKQNIFDKDGNIKNTLRKRGSFFEIAPGINGIVTNGNVTKITIIVNWRYKV